MGHVYFIQARETGYIKIGFTKDLARRLRAMEAHSGDILDLRIHITGATIVHEKALHREFAKARIYGEWFDPVPELLAVIESLRAGLQPGHLAQYDALKHAIGWH